MVDVSVKVDVHGCSGDANKFINSQSKPVSSLTISLSVTSSWALYGFYSIDTLIPFKLLMALLFSIVDTLKFFLALPAALLLCLMIILWELESLLLLLWIIFFFFPSDSC